MIVRDVVLLIKKIAIGIIVMAVPLFLFLAGLWLVRHIL